MRGMKGMKIGSSYRTTDGWHVRHCPLCDRKILSPVAFFLTQEYLEFCRRVEVHSSACTECIREFAAVASS